MVDWTHFWMGLEHCLMKMVDFLEVILLPPWLMILFG